MYVGQDEITPFLPGLRTGWEKFMDVLKFGREKPKPRFPEIAVVPKLPMADVLVEEHGLAQRVTMLERRHERLVADIGPAIIELRAKAGILQD